MSSEKDQKKGSLVPSTKREIEKYSSKIISRGLELVRVVEQKPKEGVVYGGLHRELMFRNMLVSLLQYERIKTTLAKGIELRSWADKMISLGKQGTLHARRRAFALLRDKGIVQKLFDETAPKFKDREGGYTRVYRLGWKQGDGAPLCLVELVTYASPEEKKKSTIKKAKEVLEKVTPKKREKAKEEEGNSAGGLKTKKNESPEDAIRRLKKQLGKNGILAEIRKREHYEKPSIKGEKEEVDGR